MEHHRAGRRPGFVIQGRRPGAKALLFHHIPAQGRLHQPRQHGRAILRCRRGDQCFRAAQHMPVRRAGRINAHHRRPGIQRGGNGVAGAAHKGFAGAIPHADDDIGMGQHHPPGQRHPFRRAGGERHGLRHILGRCQHGQQGGADIGITVAQRKQRRLVIKPPDRRHPRRGIRIGRHTAGQHGTGIIFADRLRGHRQIQRWPERQRRHQIPAACQRHAGGQLVHPIGQQARQADRRLIGRAGGSGSGNLVKHLRQRGGHGSMVAGQRRVLLPVAGHRQRQARARTRRGLRHGHALVLHWRPGVAGMRFPLAGAPALRLWR